MYVNHERKIVWNFVNKPLIVSSDNHRHITNHYMRKSRHVCGCQISNNSLVLLMSLSSEYLSGIIVLLSPLQIFN